MYTKDERIPFAEHVHCDHISFEVHGGERYTPNPGGFGCGSIEVIYLPFMSISRVVGTYVLHLHPSFSEKVIT